MSVEIMGETKSADILDSNSRGNEVIGETTYSVVSETAPSHWYDIFKDSRLAPLATAFFVAACNVAAPKTPEPTQVPVTPSPIVSESPFPTPTLVPTNTPITTNTPSPTVEITASPEPTPIDSMLEVWENMTTIDRWVDANNTPETFGLFKNSPEPLEDQEYTGIILGAKKLGDNDGVLYVGMEDYFRKKYIVTFKLFRGVLIDPTNDNFEGSVFDGRDIENMWTNEFLDRLSNGQYIGSLIYILQPMAPDNSVDSPYQDAIRSNEPYARSFRKFALAAREGDSTIIVDRPEFIDNSNATNGPLLYSIAMLQRPQ